VEPVTMTVAALAAAVTHLVVKAAGAFGEKVFEQVTDAAAEDTAGLGRRLLGRLIRGRATAEESAVATAAQDVVAAPDDADAEAALRLKVRRLLESEPDVVAEVRELLRSAPSTATASALAIGERAAAVTGNQNTVITGDNVGWQQPSP
jgi:hypothetical protein